MRSRARVTRALWHTGLGPARSRACRRCVWVNALSGSARVGYELPEAELRQSADTAEERVMQAIRELPRDRWADYLQDVTGEMRNVAVVIEITEPDSGPAIEAHRMALQALVYDRHDDVFEVAAARGGPHLPAVLRHLVDHPTRIEVDSLAAFDPTLISVTAQDGARTVVRIVREAAFSG